MILTGPQIVHGCQSAPVCAAVGERGPVSNYPTTKGPVSKRDCCKCEEVDGYSGAISGLWPTRCGESRPETAVETSGRIRRNGKPSQVTGPALLSRLAAHLLVARGVIRSTTVTTVTTPQTRALIQPPTSTAATAMPAGFPFFVAP